VEAGAVTTVSLGDGVSAVSETASAAWEISVRSAVPTLLSWPANSQPPVARPPMTQSPSAAFIQKMAAEVLPVAAAAPPAPTPVAAPAVRPAWMASKPPAGGWRFAISRPRLFRISSSSLLTSGGLVD
jgi:hypothetical protein